MIIVSGGANAPPTFGLPTPSAHALSAFRTLYLSDVYDYSLGKKRSDVTGPRLSEISSIVWHVVNYFVNLGTVVPSW